MINIQTAFKKKLLDLFDSYDEKNECLPRVVCPSCKGNLYSNIDRDRITQIDFSQFRLKKETRLNKFNNCECHFCELARTNGNKKIIPKNVFGTERKCDPNAKSCNSKKYEITKHCSKCFSVIQKGKSHICKTSKVVDNVQNITNTFELKTKEQLTSGLIKKVIKEKGDATSTKLLQPKGGNFLTVTIGNSKKPKETLFSIKDFQNIRTQFNLSYKATIGIATAIRTATKNLKIIEPYLKRKLIDANHTLDHFF